MTETADTLRFPVALGRMSEFSFPLTDVVAPAR